MRIVTSVYKIDDKNPAVSCCIVGDYGEGRGEKVTIQNKLTLGINNPSDQYLSGYLPANNELPLISIEHVLKSAGLVESMLKRKLKLRSGVIAE